MDNNKLETISNLFEDKEMRETYHIQSKNKCIIL